jgi:hypothetical protein
MSSNQCPRCLAHTAVRGILLPFELGGRPIAPFAGSCHCRAQAQQWHEGRIIPRPRVLRLTSPRRVHREMTQGWLSPRSS